MRFENSSLKYSLCKSVFQYDAVHALPERRLVFMAQDAADTADLNPDDKGALDHRYDRLEKRIPDVGKVKQQVQEIMTVLWNDEAQNKVAAYLENPETDITKLLASSGMSNNNTELANRLRGGKEERNAVRSLVRAQLVGTIEDKIAELINGCENEEKKKQYRTNGSRLIERLYAVESSARDLAKDTLHRAMWAVEPVPYLPKELTSKFSNPAERAKLAKEMEGGVQNVNLNADGIPLDGENWKIDQAHVLAGALMGNMNPELCEKFILKDVITRDTANRNEKIVIARLANGCQGNLFTALVKREPVVTEEPTKEGDGVTLRLRTVTPPDTTFTVDGTITTTGEPTIEGLEADVNNADTALDSIVVALSKLPEDQRGDLVPRYSSLMSRLARLDQDIKIHQLNPDPIYIDALQQQMADLMKELAVLDADVKKVQNSQAPGAAPASAPPPAAEAAAEKSEEAPALDDLLNLIENWKSLLAENSDFSKTVENLSQDPSNPTSPQARLLEFRERVSKIETALIANQNVQVPEVTQPLGKASLAIIRELETFEGEVKAKRTGAAPAVAPAAENNATEAGVNEIVKEYKSFLVDSKQKLAVIASELSGLPDSDIKTSLEAQFIELNGIADTGVAKWDTIKSQEVASRFLELAMSQKNLDVAIAQLAKEVQDAKMASTATPAPTPAPGPAPASAPDAAPAPENKEGETKLKLVLGSVEEAIAKLEGDTGDHEGLRNILIPELRQISTEISALLLQKPPASDALDQYTKRHQPNPEELGKVAESEERINNLLNVELAEDSQQIAAIPDALPDKKLLQAEHQKITEELGGASITVAELNTDFSTPVRVLTDVLIYNLMKREENLQTDIKDIREKLQKNAIQRIFGDKDSIVAKYDYYPALNTVDPETGKKHSYEGNIKISRAVDGVKDVLSDDRSKIKVTIEAAGKDPMRGYDDQGTWLPVTDKKIAFISIDELEAKKANR